MTSLNYGGPPIASDGKTVGYVEYLNSVKAGAMTQAQVDTQIANALAGYATTAYVDQQDALLAMTTYVDSRDALKVPLTQRGQANGVASLVSSKVPVAQVPTVSQNWMRGPHVPSGYNTGNITASGSEVTLYTMTVTDPGYPYKILVWGYSEAQISNDTTTGLVYVRQTSTAGNILAIGQTKMQLDWGDCVWGPTGNGTVLTGNTTLYIRGLRQQGSGSITFSNFKANCCAIAVPA